jgi:malate dehydrogenase
VIGAGEVGGAAARAIAALDCVREVRLIDAVPGVAAGKALDITQSAAVEQHATRMSGSEDIRSAAGAAAIVIADASAGDHRSREWQGEEGLALLRRIWEFAATDGSVIVCAGPHGASLIGSAVHEGRMERRRLLGSAPAAFEAAARALVAVALDGDGGTVQLMVLGDPPASAVPCWSQATVAGAALSDRLSAAQLNALDARLPRLWPPGPYALGSAASRAVQAIATGARGEMTMWVSLDGEMKMRRVVVALPVRLGTRGAERIIEPQLSPQEMVRLGAV